MPTFYLSERQVGKLMRFFMARSSQPHPFIPEDIQPLTEQEQTLARVLFTGNAAPCLKCHMTGDPVRDRTATACDSTFRRACRRSIFRSVRWAS
jgi:hypothetical protein